MWISEDKAKEMEITDLYDLAVRAALRRIINGPSSLGREADVELVKGYFK